MIFTGPHTKNKVTAYRVFGSTLYCDGMMTLKFPTKIYSIFKTSLAKVIFMIICTIWTISPNVRNNNDQICSFWCINICCDPRGCKRLLSESADFNA